jgi:lysozyme family protein
MPVSIPHLIAQNGARWHAMHLRANRIGVFDATAKRLCAADAKFRYQALEKATGVPWFVVAVIHEREASQRWTAQLGQGDPLNEVSRHDPQGRGPFLTHPGDVPGNDAFHRGALDALINCGPWAARWKDWTPGGACTLLEEYNGLGYAAMGVPSAYVWSGSDQYVSGKYVADHVYRASAVDVQEGCAPLISRMMTIDSSIAFMAELAVAA